MTIAVLGEAIADLVMQPEGHFVPHLGGSMYNVSIALARLGSSVSYLSPLSEDQFGLQFSESLEREGVIIGSSNRSKLPTSIALICLDEQGQPSYRLYRDGVADKDIDAARILELVPQNTTLFHSGSLVMTPDYLPVLREVIDSLRRKKILISMDINIRARACSNFSDYLDGIQSLLPYVDIVKASDEDLSFFPGDFEETTLAKKMHETMPNGLFILTQGSKGGLLFCGDKELPFSALQVEKIADTIGAGDTFFATFLHFLQEIQNLTSLAQIPSGELLRILKMASNAAAFNVQRQGCCPPTKAELDNMELTKTDAVSSD